MPGRFDFVGACPECGGAVTIETRSGTHTGTLRVTPFAEIRGDGRIAWQAGQGEGFALMADLVRLGVLSPSALFYLTLETEDGTLIPVGVAGGTEVNRRPLLDVLALRLRPRCHLTQKAAVEGPPLGRG